MKVCHATPFKRTDNAANAVELACTNGANGAPLGYE